MFLKSFAINRSLMQISTEMFIVRIFFSYPKLVESLRELNCKYKLN